MINRFYRSLSSSQHFKLRKAIKKILTKTQQQSKIKPEMIEARLQPLLRHMPTYHVQQTWRAKRPKTVVSHDLENPSQPPKSYHQSQLREFAKDRSKRDSILKLEHFLKTCVLCDYKEKEMTMLFDVIGSLGATSNLTQFYYKVEVKEDQILNYLLLSQRISHYRLHIQLRDSQK